MRAGLDNWIDILVLVIYFVLVLAVGLFSACRKERNSVKGYFLAGRSMLWFPIGASLFASNIGSEHFIGLAGSGAASGIAVVAFEWGAALCLPLLGWVFLPIYLSSGLFTIPEYLSKRFGGSRLRTYLSILALFLYIVTKISVDVFAGSVFIQQALGWNTYLAIIILLAVTAAYTVIGGLAAVIFTDTLQTIIMLTGAITLSILGFVKVGGITGLMSKYMDAIPDSLRYPSVHNMTANSTLSNITSHCGYPREDSFHIIRDAVNSDLPWPGLLIRSTFVSTWYWCADQVIVQRTLAAKNIAHARGATLMAGYLKFLPLFIIIMPGMISRVLFTEAIACADAETCMNVCDNPVGCSNVAYPKLILGLAPTGLRGLMMAVMMSALMSSLTSIFNSAATLFTMDLWRKMRKQATERELLVVGKIFVVVLVGISVAWIPLIQNSEQGQLFLYIQAVTGYLAPPICSVFLLAVFVPRVNEQGAFWGMLTGQIVGITRMILDFIYPKPKCGDEDTRPAVVAKVHFLYFSAGLLIFTSALVIIFSLMTRKQKNQGNRLTFWSCPSIKSGSARDKNRIEMYWQSKQSHQQSIHQQLEARASVKERWSLTEKSSKTNHGFEMQETYSVESYPDKTENRNETTTAYPELQEEHEDQYTEIKTEIVEIDTKKGLEPEPVGYEINDNDTENGSVESTETKDRGHAKVTFTTEKDEVNIEFDHDDNKESDNEKKVKKPLSKSNSKVWRREVEKQPGWQNFVLEFTKKLSEVDNDSETVIEDRVRGKDILRPVSKTSNNSTEEHNFSDTQSEIKDQGNETQVDVKKQEYDENSTNYMAEEGTELRQKPEIEDKSTTESQFVEKTTQLNEPALMQGSRYSGKLSLDIFKARTQPDSVQYDAAVDANRQKLYIGKYIKWFLDINAIILMCVFVFLYCVFR